MLKLSQLNNIRVNPSIYAALSVFALYCSVIILLLLIFNISGLTFPLFMFLLAVASMGREKLIGRDII